MVTKLIYFRPDKRHIDEETSDKNYSCVIKDDFMKTENFISVPCYLTVIQYSNAFNNRRGKNTVDVTDDKNFQGKLCFYLIGSPQIPPLQDFVTNVNHIDRIEFRGCIGFEVPVYAILKKLPGLRKIGFFINSCMQESFSKIPSLEDVKEKEKVSTKDVASVKSEICLNHAVTCLKILLETCGTKCSNCGIPVSKMKPERKEILQKMILKFLKKSVTHCPNIKRLSMDVPNWEGLKQKIDDTMQEMKTLKPTTLLEKSDWIIVRKTSDLPPSTPPEEETSDQCAPDPPAPPINPEVVVPAAEPVKPLEKPEDKDKEPVPVEKKIQDPIRLLHNPLECDDNDPTGLDQPEATPCLVDMSKLLGSMLGIPSSSSLGAPSASTSQSLIKLPLSTHNVNNANNNSLLTLGSSDKPTTSASLAASSSSEVISYAAAAAASNNKLKHLRGTGNDSQHLHYTSNGEGSRRTFLYEGTSSSNGEESSKKSNTNPSDADLGKPVFNGGASTSSTRHIKA